MTEITIQISDTYRKLTHKFSTSEPLTLTREDPTIHKFVESVIAEFGPYESITLRTTTDW
jgi:hypothetical protein